MLKGTIMKSELVGDEVVFDVFYENGNQQKETLNYSGLAKDVYDGNKMAEFLYVSPEMVVICEMLLEELN